MKPPVYERHRERVARRIGPMLTAVQTKMGVRMPTNERHPVEGVSLDDVVTFALHNVAHFVRRFASGKHMVDAILDRERLYDEWPPDAFVEEEALPDEGRLRQSLTLISFTGIDMHPIGLGHWPPNVSPNDVAEALEKTKDPPLVGIASALRKGVLIAHEKSPLRIIHPSDGQADMSFLGALKRSSLLACALIVSVEKDVREDARRKCIPIPSTKEASATMAVISQGGAKESWVTGFRQGETIELVWNNTRDHYQLALDLGTRDFDTQFFQGILNELQEDGLRDWLLLHRFAAEQGRTGKFTWRWSEHRERSAYDRRIRNDNLSDQEAAEEVTARLWKLKRADIRAYRFHNGKEGWVRIGPFGLLDIPAARPRGAALEAASLAINPELYQGAHRESEKPHFTLLPDEALLLDGKRLRLATMAALAMRYAHDEGCVARRTARSLWEYLDTRDGVPQTRYWPRADTALQRALDGIAKAGVLGSWEREPGQAGPEVVYTLRPPSWLTDQLVHRVPPEFGPSKVGLPKTGTELATWRKAKGWSQAEAAQQLGAVLKTLKRAELAAAKPLGRAIAEALGTFKG